MDGIAAYQDNSVSTQPKGRLIVLLYEGAIKFLKQAEKELQAGNFAAKGEHISKALAIIEELDACLDISAGGEIAQNLRSLYAFMRRHLWEANIQRDAKRIAEVIRILEDLNTGWTAITG